MANAHLSRLLIQRSRKQVESQLDERRKSTVVDMFGPAGQVQLNEMGLGRNYTIRVESLRDLIEVYDREIVMLEGDIHRHLRHHRGYQAVQAINGVGRTIAAIFVAEIGDVTRFPTPRHVLVGRATPGRRESDVKGHDQGITKHGSKLLRWALIEGISRDHGGPHLTVQFHRLAERRGKNKARVAIARRVLPWLLRATRRRDPLPHPARQGGMTARTRPPMASSTNGMTPGATPAASSN